MLCVGEVERECGGAVGRANMEIHGCLDQFTDCIHPKPVCVERPVSYWNIHTAFIL